MSNEKAQRQLHRLTRKATQLLREPASGALAAAAREMGFGDLQREGQEKAEAPGAAAAPGKKRLGKKAAAAAAAAAEAAAQADRALAEPETAAAMLASARGTALQQLGALPGWAATGAPAAQAQQAVPPLRVLEGSKYAAQLPRLTRRFADVAAAAVASEAAAAGAASADDLAGEAAGRALELRGDVTKGAKARKKKALTGGRGRGAWLGCKMGALTLRL